MRKDSQKTIYEAALYILSSEQGVALYSKEQLAILLRAMLIEFAKEDTALLREALFLKLISVVETSDTSSVMRAAFLEMLSSFEKNPVSVIFHSNPNAFPFLGALMHLVAIDIATYSVFERIMEKIVNVDGLNRDKFFSLYYGFARKGSFSTSMSLMLIKNFFDNLVCENPLERITFLNTLLQLCSQETRLQVITFLFEMRWTSSSVVDNRAVAFSELIAALIFLKKNGSNEEVIACISLINEKQNAEFYNNAAAFSIEKISTFFQMGLGSVEITQLVLSLSLMKASIPEQFKKIIPFILLTAEKYKDVCILLNTQVPVVSVDFKSWLSLYDAENLRKLIVAFFRHDLSPLPLITFFLDTNKSIKEKYGESLVYKKYDNTVRLLADLFSKPFNESNTLFQVLGKSDEGRVVCIRVLSMLLPNYLTVERLFQAEYFLKFLKELSSALSLDISFKAKITAELLYCYGGSKSSSLSIIKHALCNNFDGIEELMDVLETASKVKCNNKASLILIIEAQWHAKAFSGLTRDVTLQQRLEKLKLELKQEEVLTEKQSGLFSVAKRVVSNDLEKIKAMLAVIEKAEGAKTQDVPAIMDLLDSIFANNVRQLDKKPKTLTLVNQFFIDLCDINKEIISIHEKRTVNEIASMQLLNEADCSSAIEAAITLWPLLPREKREVIDRIKNGVYFRLEELVVEEKAQEDAFVKEAQTVLWFNIVKALTTRDDNLPALVSEASKTFNFAKRAELIGLFKVEEERLQKIHPGLIGTSSIF